MVVPGTVLDPLSERAVVSFKTVVAQPRSVDVSSPNSPARVDGMADAAVEQQHEPRAFDSVTLQSPSVPTLSLILEQALIESWPHGIEPLDRQAIPEGKPHVFRLKGCASDWAARRTPQSQSQQQSQPQTTAKQPCSEDTTKLGDEASFSLIVLAILRRFSINGWALVQVHPEWHAVGADLIFELAPHNPSPIFGLSLSRRGAISMLHTGNGIMDDDILAAIQFAIVTTWPTASSSVIQGNLSTTILVDDAPWDFVEETSTDSHTSTNKAVEGRMLLFNLLEAIQDQGFELYGPSRSFRYLQFHDDRRKEPTVHIGYDTLYFQRSVHLLGDEDTLFVQDLINSNNSELGLNMSSSDSSRARSRTITSRANSEDEPPTYEETILETNSGRLGISLFETPRVSGPYIIIAFDGSNLIRVISGSEWLPAALQAVIQRFWEPGIWRTSAYQSSASNSVMHQFKCYGTPWRLLKTGYFVERSKVEQQRVDSSKLILELHMAMLVHGFRFVAMPWACEFPDLAASQQDTRTMIFEPREATADGRFTMFAVLFTELPIRSATPEHGRYEARTVFSADTKGHVQNKVRKAVDLALTASHEWSSKLHPKTNPFGLYNVSPGYYVSREVFQKNLVGLCFERGYEFYGKTLVTSVDCGDGMSEMLLFCAIA
eukprot:jgi/Hompol1/696/HPOL_002587-RA